MITNVFILFSILEDPLQIMIKNLAVECNVEVLAVSETVNRMFECGLKYDSYDAVRKELQAKVSIVLCLCCFALYN